MPPSKKQKSFCDNWLNQPEFKGWLVKVKDSKEQIVAQCSACKKTLHGGKTELLRHASRATHLENVKKNARDHFHQQSLDKLIANTQSEHEKQRKHEIAVKTFELNLCAFFSEHNLAIQIVDHLVDVIKKLPDSQIAKDISLKRTKCTAVIKNILGKIETDDLVQILKNNKFSILIDETTDICMKKQMCILTRYVCPKTGKVVTNLLQLLDVGIDCSAVGLYSKFKESLLKLGISVSNIVGMASDGASVMVGKKNSFFSRLKDDVPHCLLFKCICHSAALISSKACLKLPKEPEELIKLVYLYISGSSKRCGQLEEMQSHFNLYHYKILKLSGTRWLSLHQCVERLLINWDILLAYFRIAAFEDDLSSSYTIVNLLQSNAIKAYFLFLKYALKYMNSFNALFQSDTVLIHSLFKHSRQLFEQFAQNFIKPIFLKTDKPYKEMLCPHYYLELEKVYVGGECNDFIKNNLNLEEQHIFRVNILNFYVTLAQEMIDRLPLDESFREFEFLLPCHAFNKNRTVLTEIGNITNTFGPLLDNPHAVTEEWRHLPFSFDDNEIQELSLLPVDLMWKKISEIKDYTGKIKFCNVSQLAKVILTLPHSNAEAERIFSLITDIKTKKRNCLGEDTLNAMCVIRSAFKNQNIDCVKFNPTENHLKLFNSEIYNAKE